MKNQPTLDQLYRDVAARKQRRETMARMAYLVLGALGTAVFVVALFTPQP